MDLTGTGELEEVLEEYNCRHTGLSQKDPCSVYHCPANTQKYCGEGNVLQNKTTNCAYVDFLKAGYPDEIDFAVREQGFVGLRDLSYVAPFFGIPQSRFRKLYFNNIHLLREAVSLLLEDPLFQEAECCPRCGHPTPEGAVECVSTSLCSERRDTSFKVLQHYKLVTLPNENTLSARIKIWSAAAKGKALPTIPVELMAELKELVSPKAFRKETT